MGERSNFELIPRAMPALQTYNPIVIGFVEGKGPVHIPLLSARDEYGQLPSDYGLLPGSEGRQARKALNLPIGLAIMDLLREGRNLPEIVMKFYERWGRDFDADFQVHIERFHRFNDPWVLGRIIEENSEILAECLELDVSEYLQARGLVPHSRLRSIPAEALLSKVKEVLAKKRRNPAHAGERERIEEALTLLDAKVLLGRLSTILGSEVGRWGKDRSIPQADEIARTLSELSKHLPLTGTDRLTCMRGHGVEVEFVPRDTSYLALGKQVGDCTADKLFRQVDRDIENIYWTVFSWFLDRNYQILRVYSEGQFVMKVHLLPLLALDRDGGQIFLAVDAIETTPVFREDTHVGDPDLLEKKEYIFGRMVEEVRRLAQTMGIEHVYAERFSNTAWVRRELQRFREVYLHVGSIQKIDELEDVFELSKRVCAAAGREHPSCIFMELQMRNTFLLRGAATVRGVKGFAVLAGDSHLGIPMKRVFGV